MVRSIHSIRICRRQARVHAPPAAALTRRPLPPRSPDPMEPRVFRPGGHERRRAASRRAALPHVLPALHLARAAERGEHVEQLRHALFRAAAGEAGGDVVGGLW